MYKNMYKKFTLTTAIFLTAATLTAKAMPLVELSAEEANSSMIQHGADSDEISLESQLNQKVVNINLKNSTYEEILKEIKNQTSIGFVVKGDLSSLGRTNFKASNTTAQEAITKLFSGTGYTYTTHGNTISITPSTLTQATQQKPIELKGKVVDEKGKPVIGATLISASGVGAITDDKGQFVLSLTKAEEVEVSCVGYITLTQNITESTADLTIKLEADLVDVEEVVITGMFERKEEGFTGSANTIKGDDLRKFTSGNVLSAIEMLDPGFRISQSNNAGSNPSSIPDFQMRGQSNMGDYSSADDVYLRGDAVTRPNQPLFVLDGIIGVDVTKIIDLDPSQVESVTVLKDAAAMVIYGSRASNGVIVVETKAPEAGKLRVTYNGTYKISSPDLSQYNLLNAAEKLDLEYASGLYSTAYYGSSDQILFEQYYNKKLEVLRGVDTDWLSIPVRTAFEHRHGLNIEGGDRTLRYKIYLGLNNQPGTMKDSGSSSKSGSIDLRYRYKNVLVSNITYVDFSRSDRTSPYGSFDEYALMNPYYRPYNEDGTIKKYLEQNYVRDGYFSTISTTSVLNPMYNTTTSYKDQYTEFMLRNVMKLEWQPIDNLRLNADFTYTKGTGDVDTFYPANHTMYASSSFENRGSYTWSHTKMDEYSFSLTASYNTRFGGTKNLLSVYARYELSEDLDNNITSSTKGFPNETMDEIYLGLEPTTIYGDATPNRMLGALTTINYSYDQRYAFDLSIRLDASSQFGSNNRFAPFWSTGIRYNIINEDFMENASWVNDLVVRATYGVTGNQGFTPFQANQMYTYDGMMYQYHSSDVIGAQIYALGNPDLKWQSTDTYNLALDFELFNSFVSGRFEYYEKYTTNTILDFSLAPSIGFSSVPINMGDISNKGYEATVRLTPYRNAKQRAFVNVSFMGSHNKNRIEKISNALKLSNEANAALDTERPMARYEEGYSMSMIWVVRSAGIDPMNGQEVFYTRDGDLTYEYSSLDQIPYGDTEPLIQGSINISAEYKGFSLAIGALYNAGGDIYNQTLIDRVENADIRYNVDARAATDRWQEQGDIAQFKATSLAASGSSTLASSRFVMKNNELSIANISLSYRLEQRYNPALEKLGLSAATVGFYMNDVATISSVKMERGIYYPFARSCSFSLNLTF